MTRRYSPHSERLTALVRPETKDALHALSRKDGKPLTVLLREAISDYLTKHANNT